MTDLHLSLFNEFVARTFGWNFPPSRGPDLLRGIAAAAVEMGFEDDAACAQWLMSGRATKNQLDILAGQLTVGETYFFRESRSFLALADHIIPQLIRSRQQHQRQLRIWSAACCTGEEPYSIAIALLRAIPDWRDWNITLLATDVNPRFLRKAEAGVFGSWSFRNAPPELKERYFQATGDGQFRVLPKIRRMVRFAQLNLAEEAYRSVVNDTTAMDVIFCRNVLMYFTLPQAKKVIQNLYHAQAEGGWLIVSASEPSPALFPPYRMLNLDGTILYQKDQRQPAVEATIDPVELDSVEEKVVVSSGRIRSAGKPAKEAAVARAIDPYEQADTLYREGRYDEAADQLGALLSSRPDDPAVLGLLAHCLANQGKLPEALGACDQWIGADKLNPAGHYLRSVILQERSATDDAVESLRRALYLDSEFVLAHVALGNIARGRGQMRQAERHMGNALRSLGSMKPADELPESDGITAERMAQIIHSQRKEEVVA